MKMILHTIQRLENKTSADMVKRQMKILAPSVDFYVAEMPLPDTDKQRGVGEWAVLFNNRRDFVPSDEGHRMSRCFNQALTLVLADELRKMKGNHPLLRTWSLIPEHRNSLMKYTLDD